VGFARTPLSRRQYVHGEIARLFATICSRLGNQNTTFFGGKSSREDKKVAVEQASHHSATNNHQQYYG
jgi:hypothetical protein